jgi:hypothetical protein
LRRRSWLLLALLVAAHAVFSVLFKPIDSTWWNAPQWLKDLMVGVAYAQAVLFAVWAIMGPGQLSKRVPLTMASLVMVVFAGMLLIWNVLSFRANARSFFEAPISLFVTAAVATMLVSRVTRMRIGHESDATDEFALSNQFSLKFLLGLTAICAVFLGIGRSLALHQWLPEYPDLEYNHTIDARAVRMALVLLPTLPGIIFPLVALLPRPTIRMLVAIPLLWVTYSWMAIETVIAVEHSPYWAVAGDRSPLSDVVQQLTLLQLGAATAGLSSALVVRLAGYRFVHRDPPSNQLPASSP